MEGYYPEGLYRLFIVRAPSTVSIAYNMVKVGVEPRRQNGNTCSMVTGTLMMLVPV